MHKHRDIVRRDIHAAVHTYACTYARKTFRYLTNIQGTYSYGKLYFHRHTGMHCCTYHDGNEDEGFHHVGEDERGVGEAVPHVMLEKERELQHALLMKEKNKQTNTKGNFFFNCRHSKKKKRAQRKDGGAGAGGGGVHRAYISGDG